MANTHSTLTGLFADIADAIRVKTGGTDSIVADAFPEAIAAIDTQENLDAELTTQDDLIAQLATALEGKAIPDVGGGTAKTTKTIYLDWSGDDESTCEIDYVSNNTLVYLGCGNETPDVIEAEGGVVCMRGFEGSYYSSNFIQICDEARGGYVLMATQDGETIYLFSSSEQQ